MKKTIQIVFASIVLVTLTSTTCHRSGITQRQTNGTFEGYKILAQAFFDSTIIGQKYNNGHCSGDPTKAFKIDPGLDTVLVRRGTNIEAGATAAIRKVVTTKLGLNLSDTSEIKLVGFRTYRCTNLARINGLNEGNQYVIDAIALDQVQVSKRSLGKVTAKLELDSTLTKGALKVSSDGNGSSGTISFVKGRTLFVAVRLLEVAKTTVIRYQTTDKKDTLFINNEDNSGFFVDNGQINFQFRSMDPIDETTFRTSVSQKEHQGCFYLHFNTDVGSGGNVASCDGHEVYCPYYENISGEPKPKEENYRPFDGWYTGSPRIICSDYNKSQIKYYLITLFSLKSSYRYPPTEEKLSNYKIKRVTAKILLKAMIHTYRIVTV